MVIDPFPHNDAFRRVWVRSLLKILWEKEKLLVQAIFPFPTMFSTLSKTEVVIFVNSIRRLQMVSFWSGPKFCRVGMVKTRAFHFVSGHTTLYHHTDVDSAIQIMESGIIFKSVTNSWHDDAVHGDGTYLTKIGPDASKSCVIRNNYDGNWRKNKSKAAVAIEVTVPKSRVENYSTADRSIFKYKGNLDLDNAKNVKVHFRDDMGGY